MYLLILGRLELHVNRIGTAFLEEQDLRFRLLRREAIILIANKPTESKALYITKAIPALFVNYSKFTSFAIFLLIIANNRKKILINEYLIFGLSLLKTTILPDKYKFI